VTITRDGYIKRVEYDAYRKQGRGGKGVRSSSSKEGDVLEHLFTASTHNFLLVFTNRGRVYWLKVYDIPAMSRTARGRSIANLLQMQDNEHHRAILPVREFEESYVFFATAKGIVKKTPLAAYSRPRPSGIIAMGLDADDELIGVALSSGEEEIVLGSREGMAVRFDESDVRAMGRSARGVKGMDLRKGDSVVGMVVTNPKASLLTVCENGYGKRTQVEEYRKTRRGGKGVINIKTTERNGKVVSIQSVVDTDELMLITAQGIALRIDLSTLREIGRATQGVRVIRLGDGDKLVAVTKLVREEDAGELGEASPGPSSESPETPDPSGETEGEPEGESAAGGVVSGDDTTDDTADEDAPGGELGEDEEPGASSQA